MYRSRPRLTLSAKRKRGIHSPNPSERTPLVPKLELGNQGAGTDGFGECSPSEGRNLLRCLRFALSVTLLGRLGELGDTYHDNGRLPEQIKRALESSPDAQVERLPTRSEGRSACLPGRSRGRSLCGSNNTGSRNLIRP